ncbi:MAG: outer membrane protein assembly factor [Runella slithyformis]|nr:MAG: outer membrane protein assembly factor [Runella slithyformis]
MVYRFLVIILVVLAGCSPKVTLQKDQYLLNNQIFRGNKNITTDELTALLPQKPNKKLFGIPGLTVSRWFYAGGLPRYERKRPIWQIELDSLNARYERINEQLPPNSRAANKWRRRSNKQIEKLRNRIENGTWVMRALGEPPVYFADADARRNAKKIKDYAISKGYRAAQVGYELDTVSLAKNIIVKYFIAEGKPYKLRKVDLLTHQDPDIDTLIKRNSATSTLKAGENYQYNNVILETVRLEKLMRNNGYFGFNRQFLLPRITENRRSQTGGFLIDTTVVVPQTDSLFRSIDVLGLQVNYPKGQNRFLSYRFSEVNLEVTSLLNPNLVATALPKSEDFQNINYKFADRYYSPKVLNTKILLRPNSLFKQEALDETYRQLSLLDQFRFINIDTDTSGNTIKANIRAVPYEKYQTTFEVGGNVVGSNLPGPFANGTFRIRNVFQHLENFEISARGAYDLQTGLNGLLFFPTIELGINASLIFPRILFPGKWVGKLNEKGPRTILSLGFNYIDRQPFFTRSGYRANMTYSWRKSQNEFVNFTPLDFNVLRTRDKSNEFNQLLDQLFNQLGSPLFYSFLDRAFVSSMSVSYVYNNDVIGQNKRARYLRLFAESGGTTLNLLRTQELPLLKDYTTYKFIKTNVEYRRYLPIRRNSRLVFRANAGVIFNYGQQGAAPYEKYFTGGGSNSLRAWPPRRLGLGSAYPNVDSLGRPVFIRAPFTIGKDTLSYGSFDYRFEQLGDVILEANLELRGRLFKFYGDINYALFIDVGNTWRLPTAGFITPKDQLQNPNFALDRFYRELSVGTGVGLRWDFSYFIFRFDFGVKVYDPSRRFKVPTNDGGTTIVDDRYLLPRFSFKRDSPNFPVLNIGIGYPF